MGWHAMSTTAPGLLAGATAMLALAGCLGETSNPPAQQAAARAEVTGTVTDGAYAGPQSVAGKGAEGIPRSSRSSPTGTYALSLAQLAGPYLLANTLSPGSNPDLATMTSLATRPGVANITPLTTLLTAQLLGVTPANAISSFDSGAGGLPGLVTEATLAAAQVDLAGFLRDVYDLDTGSASFVSTPFTATAGNPMFDAIVALNDKLSGSGQSLGSVAAQVATGARSCEEGSVQVTFTGGQRRFCAIFRTALADEEDGSITNYRFRNAAGEQLFVGARGTQVLSARFERLGTAYTCATTACTGISFDPPAEDESRFVNFSSTALTATGGNLSLTGRLKSGIPGLELPPLPCADNRFYMVFADNSVVGDCISLSNDPFSMGGNFGSDVEPGRTSWSLANSQEPLPATPSVQIVLDVSDAQPRLASVFYVDHDPDTFEQRNIHLCRFAECGGVTIGSATVDTTTAPGYAISRRSISFNATVLPGYAADGTATGAVAQFTGTFTLLSTPNELAWPSAAACGSTADTIAGEVAGRQFNLCIPPNDLDSGSWFRYVYDNGDGTMQVVASNEAYDSVTVLLDQGAVTEVTASVSGAQFQCRASCIGVTVSTPDASGTRKLTIAGTLLPHLENYPLPGDHVLKLNVTELVVPLYQ